MEPPDPVPSAIEAGEIPECAVGGTSRESNAESKFADDSGGEELEGGEVSENEVMRNSRTPVLDTKQVFELAKASVDRRHYFVIASRLDKNVIALVWKRKEEIPQGV